MLSGDKSNALREHLPLSVTTVTTGHNRPDASFSRNRELRLPLVISHSTTLLSSCLPVRPTSSGSTHEPSILMREHPAGSHTL